MTQEEFAAAAADGQKVRLRDQSRCFYVDEWYEPIVDDNGAPATCTHTGETSPARHHPKGSFANAASSAGASATETAKLVPGGRSTHCHPASVRSNGATATTRRSP